MEIHDTTQVCGCGVWVCSNYSNATVCACRCGLPYIWKVCLYALKIVEIEYTKLQLNWTIESLIKGVVVERLSNHWSSFNWYSESLERDLSNYVFKSKIWLGPFFALRSMVFGQIMSINERSLCAENCCNWIHDIQVMIWKSPRTIDKTEGRGLNISAAVTLVPLIQYGKGLLFITATLVCPMVTNGDHYRQVSLCTYVQCCALSLYFQFQYYL